MYHSRSRTWRTPRPLEGLWWLYLFLWYSCFGQRCLYREASLGHWRRTGRGSCSRRRGVSSRGGLCRVVLPRLVKRGRVPRQCSWFCPRIVCSWWGYLKEGLGYSKWVVKHTRRCPCKYPRIVSFSGDINDVISVHAISSMVLWYINATALLGIKVQFPLGRIQLVKKLIKI